MKHSAIQPGKRRGGGGMPTLALLLLLPAAWLAAGKAAADQVLLAGGGRLSGVLRGMTAAGELTLDSPLAAEPLLLRGEALREVIFSGEAGEPGETGEPPSARVELVNGDVIPGELEALDERGLAFITPAAGRLQIPRAAVKSLQLGIHPPRPVYTGPASAEDFTADGTHGTAWRYDTDDHLLRCQGQGRVSKNLEPLDHFIVKFTLEWDDTPSFQFFFAEPAAAATVPADRYFFQFSPAGVEIKREAATGRRVTTIATLNRPPGRYTDKRLEVEIRVDRAESILHLFLDGQPEGRYYDPVRVPVTGGGISLASNAGNDAACSVRSIQVLAWNPAGDRHRTQDHGDASTDALIGKSGDLFHGRLLSIRPGAGGPLFSFKSDFQEAPLELPEPEVSAIFLKAPAAAPDAAAAAEPPFSLRLRGQGLLRVSTCEFPSGTILASHPLLGKMTLTRSGVAALERRDGKGAPP